MRCTVCGGLNEDAAQFCQHCGAAIGTWVAADAKPSPTRSMTPTAVRRGTLAAVIMAMAAFSAVAYFAWQEIVSTPHATAPAPARETPAASPGSTSSETPTASGTPTSSGAAPTTAATPAATSATPPAAASGVASPVASTATGNPIASPGASTSASTHVPADDAARAARGPASDARSSSASPGAEPAAGSAQAGGSAASASAATAPSRERSEPSRHRTDATAKSAARAPSHGSATHWRAMRNELSNCRRESALERLVCDQRVRIAYCAGYWGKVAQCPDGMRDADKGQ